MMSLERKCIWLVAVLFVLEKPQKVFGQDGSCVMEGPCQKGDFGDLNCLRVRPPNSLNNHIAWHMLKDICPELVPSENSPVCCNRAQVEALDTNFLSATAILGRCPSCIENFRKIFCHFTCSPNQAKFVNVTETKKADDGKLLIKSATYYVNTLFLQDVYDSCKDVQGLVPGSTALELMCGPFGSDCNPQRWVDFMGSTPDDGGFSPFHIDIILTSESVINQKMYPLKINTVKCSEAAGHDKMPCSPADCEYPVEY